MRTYTVPKPVGNDAQTDHVVRQQERVQSELQFYDSDTVKVEHTTRGIRLHAKFPPQQNQPNDSFFPFKVYQPTNILSFQTGITFLGSDGVATVCNIDPTAPTNFAANPPTVNPFTDPWRFWAVRSGLVEIRPIYNVPSPNGTPTRLTASGDPLVGCSNWAYRLYLGKNADGVMPSFHQAVPVAWSDPTEETVNPPLIFSGDPDPINQPFNLYGGIWFSLWIEISPDTLPVNPDLEVVNGLTARIVGKTWRNRADGTDPFPNDGGPLNIPLAIISPTFQGDAFSGSYTTTFVVDQQLFNHVVNRYPPGQGTSFLTPIAGAAGFGANVMNVRGVFYADDGSFDPADLDQQVFYPGDIVIAKNVSQATPFLLDVGYQFIGNQNLSPGQPGAWEDPTASNAWRILWTGQNNVPA